MRDKITPAIDAHFFYDFDLMMDFLSYSRYDFLDEHPELSDIEYNNTIVKVLNAIGIDDHYNKPIGQIQGIDLHELCRKRNVTADYLLTFCS